MTKNKQVEEIFKKYPEICEYGLMSREVCREPISWYGIECGSGWFYIIDNALSDIHKYCTDNDILDKVRVSQIKEKIGGLRIYVEYDKSISNSEYRNVITEMIRKSEIDASQTCDRCGRIGKLSTVDNFMVVICSECKNKID